MGRHLIDISIMDETQEGENSQATAFARKTVFIRNLPFETSNEKLEKEFSDYGPVKKAFVVKDRDNISRCRGFGYVQFVLQDDADTAVKTEKKINGRILKISYADKKPKHKTRKREQQSGETSGVESNELTLVDSKDHDKIKSKNEKHQENVKEKSKEKLTKKQKLQQKSKIEESNGQVYKKSSGNTETELQRTIVVTGLTEKVKRKALRLICEKYGTIENIVYPVPERSERTAYVRFQDIKGAVRASQKIAGQKIKKSKTLSSVLLTKEGKKASKKVLQQSRIIIRNLSFKCEEDDLKDIFSKYGNIVSISIPTKEVKGTKRKIGCAFIQFGNPKNASAAIEEMNLQKIKERPVVIDWAVSKDVYDKDGKISDEMKATPKPGKVHEGNTDDPKNKNNVKIDRSEEKSDENRNESDVNDLEEGSEDNGSGDEVDENDDEEEENDENYETEDKDSEVDDDEGDSGIEEEEDERKPKRKEPKPPMKDAKEGRTIFLRNLAYETDEDILLEEFEKYGDIDYCKLVTDPHTGRSKGTAFIKFFTKESADKCIKEVTTLEDRGKNLQLDGRTVKVSLAVTRGKLMEINRQATQKDKESDKRNLYLAYEGLITKTTAGADQLSEADLKRREKAFVEKKKKLNNPNYFVSKTRLCIRNIPLAADTNELRKILLKVVPNTNIERIKIMRSKDRLDSNGQPRSLGYGFIEMGNHESALKLLRATNNNPEIFGEKRRPMVEFSIENTKALKILEQRKNKHNSVIIRNEENLKDPETIKRKKEMRNKRWKKRIDKFIKRREELKKSKNENDSLKDVNRNEENVRSSKHSKLQSFANNETSSTSNKSRKRKLEKDTTEDFINVNSKRRRFRKSKNRTEETKFHDLISKYKSRILQSEKVVVKKTSSKDGRWYE